jgi:hypothetical protein
MALERLFVDTLAATIDGPAYYGIQPQPPDETPAPLPVSIVNRPDSRWPRAFCGTDVNLEMIDIQVDLYHETAEGARRNADRARAALAALRTGEPGSAVAPTLISEQSFYDRQSRAWRVMQRWTATDYEPALP